nr:MAG TPA: hypothetical protein [Caudoviricetes sp.]
MLSCIKNKLRWVSQRCSLKWLLDILRVSF